GAPLQVGQTTTFLYFGEAEAVGLRHWMDVFRPLPAFTRHDGTNLWSLTVDLPERSRIEYKLSIKSKGRRRLILDPLNPQLARDPFGRNSVVTGPYYERPAWSLPSSSVTPGSLTVLDVSSDIFGETRRAHVYLPASDVDGPWPLLVAHDGCEYTEYAALTTVLDNLIAEGEIPPVACVLSDPGDRMAEYTGDDRHAEHIVHELIPAVAGQITVDPNRMVALGASLGGVASLHAAWRHPGVFSALILQSGSFVTALGGKHRRGQVFAPVVEFMLAFLERPGRLPARMHLSCGRFDGLITENRRMSSHFRALGVDVEFEEVPDGHNWENWRDRLRGGLVHAFGPVISNRDFPPESPA
ncbi:MAG: prolyl oligopeptidase family serine peptidase, partial [Acidimicrobiia bacterium]|nr:prolyl oligopeptidase family serine peptidase [Acidimicrobiia bacterium]NNL27235.1 esterase family protein [Acidimicrobiia bacterium]